MTGRTEKSRSGYDDDDDDGGDDGYTGDYNVGVHAVSLGSLSPKFE